MRPVEADHRHADDAAASRRRPWLVRIAANGKKLTWPRWSYRTWSTAGISAGTILLALFLSLTTSTFLTVGNILDVARQSSLLGLMTIGLTYVLISGQIDLSVGSIYGLSGVVTALGIVRFENALVGVALGLSVGLLAGIINGVLSSYARLPSFMVTLGTLEIMLGIGLLLTGGANQGLFGTQAWGFDQLTFFGQGTLLGIPMQFVMLCVIGGVAWVVLGRTVYGLRAYASGGSPSAAAAAGVRVPRVQLIAFCISGFLSAVAGVLAVGFISSVSPVSGQGTEFDVFAAAVLGGASLFGGQGSVPGAVLGAVFLGVLRNGLLLLGVSAFVQIVVIGCVTIGAVAINRVFLQRSLAA